MSETIYVVRVKNFIEDYYITHDIVTSYRNESDALALINILEQNLARSLYQNSITMDEYYILQDNDKEIYNAAYRKMISIRDAKPKYHGLPNDKDSLKTHAEKKRVWQDNLNIANDVLFNLDQTHRKEADAIAAQRANEPIPHTFIESNREKIEMWDIEEIELK